MQQFKIALVLAVCSAYTLVSAAGCTDDGYFVVEDNCNSYYRCVDQRRVDFACPAGQNFDTDTFVCRLPNEANCKNSGIKQTTPKPRGTKKPSEPTAECPQGDGLFEVADDCTRFYECAEGTRFDKSCPPTLHFDKTRQVCDYPAEAKCEN